tara:strand:- start:70954 stop:71478 length:525 start_codon:yes stop_codon:yes gene_type:complete
MYSNRPRNQKRARSGDLLERKMDQWLETGRQLVDGVSGNRPGRRKTGRTIGDGIDNVGRWVGDKLDWFFEEEDDWMEPWELEERDSTVNFSNSKRPLQAISLRGTKTLGPSSSLDKISSQEEDSWPDESSFRVDRWERQKAININNSRNSLNERKDSSNTFRRPLPKSSRRRIS